MAKNEIVNFGKIADIVLSDVPEVDNCAPGMEPVEYNLIIAPAKAPEKVGSKGLILVADETKERMGLAAQIGRIVAASPLAFTYEKWPEGSRMPQVGDVVWFARYAGGLFEGSDGKEYRIIKDKDIGAVISRAYAAAAVEEVPTKFLIWRVEKRPMGTEREIYGFPSVWWEENGKKVYWPTPPSGIKVTDATDDAGAYYEINDAAALVAA